MTQAIPLHCPKCGHSTKIVCHGKRYTLYPLGCSAIAGIPLAILHQASMPVDYECESCGATFGRRSRLTKFCIGITLLTFLLVLVSILLFFYKG